jgi:inhibitor of cysteine peptidase
MKLGLILTCTALILLLCLPSCTTGASVEVSCDDFMQQKHISKEVGVAVGDSFTVTLCSNATTGFQWSESAQISDPTVIQQMKHESVPPGTEEAEGLVGAPGKEVWTFKALKKGTSTINLEYSRPWEGGEQGEWTFNLTVVIK